MLGVPWEYPTPTGCSTQSTLVRLVHLYGFSTGANVPAIHVNGPFSVRRPDSELQPGPPLSLERFSHVQCRQWLSYHIVTSSTVCSAVEGKNQKKSFRVSSGLSEISSSPA